MLLLGGGLFLICLLFPFNETYPIVFCVLSKLGDILLISALLSFLTNTAEYLGVFRKALEEIVYDPKFLRNRKDIEDVWENVSKVLFKSRFPQISHNLLVTIKKNYLSDNEVSYYGDYKNIYDIKYDSEDKRCVIVKNDINFTLHAVDTSDFTFPIKSWICSKDGDKQKTFFNINSIHVNGDLVVPKQISIIHKDGQLCFHYEITLKGSTEYKIKQSLEKRYSLDCDNYIGFQAKWLVNNLTVQLFHPEDMEVLFINRAASESFNLIKKKENYLEYEYKGLILRKQGYIMILNTNNRKYE